MSNFLELTSNVRFTEKKYLVKISGMSFDSIILSLSTSPLVLIFRGKVIFKCLSLRELNHLTCILSREHPAYLAEDTFWRSSEIPSKNGSPENGSVFLW